MCGLKWGLGGFGATDIILFLCCSGFNLCLRTDVLRFASRPADSASLNLYHEAILPICSGRWNGGKGSPHPCVGGILAASFRAITGDFGVFAAQPEVLAAAENTSTDKSLSLHL